MRRGYHDPQPLVELVERRARENGRGVKGYVQLVFGDGMTRTFERWRAGTPVRTGTADIVACRLGVHPANLWPDWYRRA